MPAFETRYFPFASFLKSLCQGLLANLVLQIKGYLCDFSLLLIYSYMRNWDYLPDRGSCILDLNRLLIVAKGISTRLLVSLLGTDVIDGIFTYSFGTCLLYRTQIKANM